MCKWTGSSPSGSGPAYSPSLCPSTLGPCLHLLIVPYSSLTSFLVFQGETERPSLLLCSPLSGAAPEVLAARSPGATRGGLPRYPHTGPPPSNPEP